MPPAPAPRPKGPIPEPGSASRPGDRAGAEIAGGIALRGYAPGDGGLLARWLADADLNVPAGLADGRLDARLTENPHILCRLIAPTSPGAPLGFYRLDRAPDGLAELALVVEPGARRSGLGRLLLADATDHVLGWQGRGLLAYVRPHNHTAQAFFAAAGFQPSASPEEGAAGAFLRLERWLAGGGR